jgi:hypothetical protein
MRCPACGFENASGIKFCGECSASLQVKAYSDVQGLACANRGDDPREGDGGLNRERFPFASVKSGATTVSVRFARQRLSASRHLRRSLSVVISYDAIAVTAQMRRARVLRHLS